jgi:hypothetical protein
MRTRCVRAIIQAHGLGGFPPASPFTGDPNPLRAKYPDPSTARAARFLQVVNAGERNLLSYGKTQEGPSHGHWITTPAPII